MEGTGWDGLGEQGRGRRGDGETVGLWGAGGGGASRLGGEGKPGVGRGGGKGATMLEHARLALTMRNQAYGTSKTNDRH